MGTGFKLIAVISLVANVLLLAWNFRHKPVDNGPTSEIAGRTEVFAASPATQDDTVFAGDSIVERCPWTAYLGIPVLNRGVDWDTVPGVLSRLPEIKRHHPKTLIVLAGVNDDVRVHASPEQIARELLTVEDSKAAQRIIILGLLPVDGVLSKSNHSIESVNELLVKEISPGNYIAPSPDFDPKTMTYDGVHPNGEGYKTIAAQIKKAL